MWRRSTGSPTTCGVGGWEQGLVALLDLLQGRQLDASVSQAGEPVATVIGQDLEQDAHMGASPRRGSSTAQEGHVASDPDTEIITGAAASAANVGDGQLTGRLTANLDELDRDTDDEDDTE